MSRIRLTKGWQFLRRNDTQFQENANSLTGRSRLKIRQSARGWVCHLWTYSWGIAALGGGIRYPHVNKDTKKDELIRIITPLFSRWKNCLGKMEDYTIDISTDVHDAQLMQDESVEDTMLRLWLKHLWPVVRERILSLTTRRNLQIIYKRVRVCKSEIK